MIQQRMWALLSNGYSTIHLRGIKTTTALPFIQKWRKERGLPMNPNACGVLLNSPDYSFRDGRMTPFGVGQKKRILKQREVRDQIISLTGEIDFAVERHKSLEVAERNRKNRILGHKLKPKGLELLKSK
ncbi:hypothetical protein JTB14_004341 [Gonioctena quinquepunctata]|nr:hypothetical protein JTB14_004341 [Gonioctena quinquepunctata]